MKKANAKQEKNPFGHTDIKDAAAYVRKLRGKTGRKSDKKFLEEIRRLEKLKS